MVRFLAAIALASALVGALVVGASPAAAQATPHGFKRITLDHVEARPSILHDLVRLRLFVSAIDLESQGGVLAISGDKVWHVDGGSALKKIPYLAGVYASADTETAIVFVVETSYDDATLAEIKTNIKDELLTPLEGLPHLQVSIIGYGEDMAAGKLTKLSSAANQLEGLAAGEPTEQPVLVEAVDRAVKELKKAKPTVEGVAPSAIRRMIVVVSDGHTEDDDDHDAITQLAQRANKLAIRIHSIAYSPEDSRRPLLALGELSKVSNGTFRWVQQRIDDTSLRLPFKRLLDEILHQYVLTMFVPAGDVPGKISVSTTYVDRELSSADVKVPAQLCGEDECKPGQWCAGARCVSRRHEEGRGALGWIGIVVGIGIGALALLIGVGFVVTKVRERGARPIAPPPGPPTTAQPAVGPATAAHAAAPAPPPAAPAAPIHGPQLYVMTGPQAGQRIPLRHGFTLGKAPGCDLSLAHDGFASSHHAHILMDAGGNCSLVDQGSTNGTYVNGVRVTESRLFDGMSIRCGSTELRFLLS